MISILNLLLQWDQELLLFLNQIHAPWSDALWMFCSARFTWIPLYVFWLFVLYKQYPYPKFIYLLLGVIVLILLTDQGASTLFKPLVQRLRPCQVPELTQQLWLPDKCGGKYGFFSSHAANAMGLAVFLGYWLKSKPIRLSLLIWMLATSISRIFLGAHFPGDIIAGWVWGFGIAMLVIVGIRKWILKTPGLMVNNITNL